MTLRKFVTESFLYTLSTILTRAILFLVIPLYVAYLSPDDFGLANLFQMYVGFGSIVVLLGLDQSIIRFFPKASSADRQGYFTTALATIVGTIIVVTVGLIVFKSTWTHILFDNRLAGWHILWLVSILISESVYIFLGSTFKAQREAKQLLVLNLIKFSVFLVSNVVCLVFFHLGIYAVLVSFLLCNLFYIGAGFRIWHYFNLRLLSIEKLKTMLRYGLPLAPNIVFALVLFQADHYLLKEFCGMTVVGYYAFGYKIGGALIYILWVINNAWMPHLFNLEVKEIPYHLTKILLWTLFITILLYLVLDGLARTLGTFILPETYWPSLPIITWVGLAYLIFIFTNIIDTIFHYNKKVKYVPIISAISAILNVGLNLWLIPRYAMAGAVWATVISFFVACLLTLFFLYRHNWILFDWQKVFKLLLFFFVVKGLMMIPLVQAVWVEGLVQVGFFVLFFVGVFFILPEFKDDVKTGFVMAKDKLKQ